MAMLNNQRYFFLPGMELITYEEAAGYVWPGYLTLAMDTGQKLKPLNRTPIGGHAISAMVLNVIEGRHIHTISKVKQSDALEL